MSELLQVQNGRKVLQKENIPTDELVCIFHGYGANRENLYDIALEMSQELPRLRFIIPNAIQRFEGGGNGYQWFSLKNYTQQAMQEQLEVVGPKIAEWIQLRLKELNLNENNLHLVGFSQGGMVALNLTASGFISPKKVIALSSMFVPPAKINSASKNVKILATHGTFDTVLPIEISKNSYNLLQNYGLKDFQFISEKGVAHNITNIALQKSIEFLKI